MRTLKSALIVLILGLMTAVVVGLLAIAPFLPALIQRFACEPYGIRCAVGQANIYLRPLLTADLVIDHLTLLNPDRRGPALRVKQLTATVNLSSLVFTRQAMPAEIRIENPDLLLKRLDDGRWNLLALAQEVQQHLRPATRPAPLQFPRVSVIAGTLQIDSHQVADVNLALEPKPAPLLFELQAQAAINGHSVQLSGTLSNTLDGQIQAQLPEGRARGTVRFHLDQPGRALAIPEWLFETHGVLARGKAAFRYGDWPPAYTLTVAAWQADLSALADRLSLPWLSGLTGIVEGRPTTLQGRWPGLPVGQVAAVLKGGRLELPAQRVRIVGLTGDFRLYRTEHRLQLQAGLYGKALTLPGQRYGAPSLRAAFSVDPATGDATVETLDASIAGASVKVRGSGQQWGRDSLDLMTTELTIEPTLFTQFFRLADRGVSLERLDRPSIRLRWHGEGRPWQTELASRSIQLHAAAVNGAVTAQNARIAAQGTGTSAHNLHGVLAVEQLDIAGRQLGALETRFEVGSDSIRISEFRMAVGNGTIRGHASFSRSAPTQEMRAALSVRGIRPQALFPPTAQPAGLPAIPLGAEMSAVLSRGLVTATVDLPPAVTEQARRWLLRMPQTTSAGAAGGHLLFQVQGILRSGQEAQASGSVRVQGLRELLAGGDPTDRALPVELGMTYRKGRLSLNAQELSISAAELSPLVSRLADRRIMATKGRLTISADAAFGGSHPLTAGGTIRLQGLSFGLVRENIRPTALLTGVRGAVAFTLDGGLLTIKETTLRTDEEVTLVLAGNLPLGQTGAGTARAHLSVPWTEVSALRPTLIALTGGPPEAIHLAGRLRADLELIGDNYRGTLALQHISIQSNFFSIDTATGVIPLRGRIGQNSIAFAGRTPYREQMAERQRMEQAYHAAAERLSKLSAEVPASLTIRSLSYDPIELRNIEFAFAVSQDRIAIQRFGFAALGGRWSGWGAVGPPGGEIALTVLTEGLSLRAICDAFPPIKGYINGRINGMVDLRIPRLALHRAQGNARFWAVDSPHEKRKISRTLIEKLAGQQIRYFSLFGVARRYDRGVLEVALKAGDLIFHELEISHTILGFRDLDVRVSPTFNKIGSAHLLESIGEAIERIRASAKPND